MPHSYTPGLRVTERAAIRKERRLPIAGEVTVGVGEAVRAEDVVARAELPGDVATVNVVSRLAISAGEIDRYMLKKEGDAVAQDEVIAETRSFLKWFRNTAKSPMTGTIETISKITGQVMVRGGSKPVSMLAYIDGRVTEVHAHEGVVVETRGALVQGILGIGGEVTGELAVVGAGPDAVIGPDDLEAAHADRIVVAGSQITSEVYRRAAEIGIAALVCGGFDDSDLRQLLGYDLGVAITGHEKVRPTLIMTEGFGRISMAARTYELLAARVGRRASGNGATQIRAGVLRPEIIIPADPSAEGADRAGEGGEEGGLAIGRPVRIIREPDFGRLGTVRSLPVQPVAVPCEAQVRVVEVEFSDGAAEVVPRANVEVIVS